MSEDATMSYSELQTLRQCGLKHQLAYLERWSKPRPDGSPAVLGTSWHSLLATAYAMKRDGAGGAAIRDEVASRISDTEHEETRDRLYWMWDGYCAAHMAEGELDPQYEILAVEYRFSVPLQSPQHRPSRTFRLVVVCDLVVRDHALGNVWVIDHKSKGRKGQPREADLDLQLALYIYALNTSGEFGPITGAMHNVAMTKQLKREMTLDERFVRTPTVRTPYEVNAIVRDALIDADWRYRQADELELTDRDAPRNVTPDCAWKCSFTEPCLAALKTGWPIELSKNGFTQNRDKARIIVSR